MGCLFIGHDISQSSTCELALVRIFVFHLLHKRVRGTVTGRCRRLGFAFLLCSANGRDPGRLGPEF
jgi:hypothetical protein